MFFKNDYMVVHFNLVSGLGKLTSCELPSKITRFDFCPSIERKITDFFLRKSIFEVRSILVIKQILQRFNVHDFCILSDIFRLYNLFSNINTSIDFN